MTEFDRDRAFNLVERGDFEGALPLLLSLLRDNHDDANLHHLTGFCLRAMNRIPEAIPFLERATKLYPDNPAYWCALGVALQLMEDFEGAVEALRAAFEVDPSCVEAVNSLALTQKKMGELDKALGNYDIGAEILVREIAKEFNNSRANQIFKSAYTKGACWVNHSVAAAFFLAAQEGCGGCSFPTDEQAMKEERTEEHAGLYWTSLKVEDNENVRLYLPNYFNTLREALRGNQLYATLIGNRGTVLEMLGRAEEAMEHFSEAEEFSSF